MTKEEQLELWLKGESIHNRDRDECTPDFSCCTPDLLAPLEKRKIFVNALKYGDNETVHNMLAEFLKKMLESHGFNDCTVK